MYDGISASFSVLSSVPVPSDTDIRELSECLECDDEGVGSQDESFTFFLSLMTRFETPT